MSSVDQVCASLRRQFRASFDDKVPVQQDIKFNKELKRYILLAYSLKATHSI